MKKNKNLVHIICILDRSGSMSSLQSDVIGSFNNFVKEQQGEKGDAILSLVLFDNQYDLVYDKIPLKDVKPIDEKIYYARGMTALYDGIGRTISDNNDKDAMVLIQTDGEENSSKEYTHTDLQKLIKEKEDLGWDFIFLGANIDVEAEGASIGLDSSKSIAFAASSNGVSMAYDSMDMATKSYRSAKLEEWDSEK